MKVSRYRHEFVEFIPNALEDGVLYVSIEYATTTHTCMCGCGMKVVAPLSPTDWRAIYDGETVSLRPSIGNWSFPCQSHYLLTEGRVRWVRSWSQDEIEHGRRRDALRKRRGFDQRTIGPAERSDELSSGPAEEAPEHA